jgi:hypothetical protein
MGEGVEDEEEDEDDDNGGSHAPKFQILECD